MAALSGEQLQQAALKRRAIEAVIWGMPAVNFDLMREALLQAMKGKDNQVVFYSRLPSWKNQTLTPNPDSIYIIPFYDTHDGPVVLEVPPAEGGTFVGSIDDLWQVAIEDVGPAGFDKGKGGKYLILPPGCKGSVPEGYFPMPSQTYRGFAILRSMLKSTESNEVATAVAYGKRIKMYPLAQATNPPATQFLDAVDTVFDSTIKYDASFFTTLDRVIQSEPCLARDAALVDQLKTIGIVKGKPFQPDAQTRLLLNEAAREAHLWLDSQCEALFKTTFFPGTHWAVPASPELIKAISEGMNDPNNYPVDARGTSYTMGFFSAKHLGAGQFYLMTIRDKNGNRFAGRNTYRLSVPPNAPVNQYWSATLYDRETHALIRDQKWSSRSSQSAGLQRNPNGSVDLFFGPQAPAGKDTNWVPTNAERDFEVLFRLYGPEKSFFDKVWKLPDIELADNQ